MARDLLPAARGGIKPDSHSVFNELILDDDPMDGSRSLRKRKSPSDEADEPPRAAVRKRRKASVEEEEDELNHSPAAQSAGPSGLDGTESQGGQPSADGDSPRRPGRPQRHLKARKKGARILSRTEEPRSLILAIPVTVAQWDEIERNVIKKQKRRERDRIRRARNQRATATAEAEEPQHFPAVQTTIYTNPFYAFPDRETDELKGKPYGGILTDAEAETSRTYPQDADRKAFQAARDKAEQQWKEKTSQTNGETPARSKSSGPPSKIKCINFGGFEIDTWHAAPYPEEYSRNKHLYICEFCLKYMSSDYVAWRHKVGSFFAVMKSASADTTAQLKCSAKHPPGDEIYRSRVTNPETGAETTLSFFEVDGRRNPLYCQNLCLLAKLFLGSKTLYYDVEPFLFYIMTENDEFGCHFVGYFSKEKRGCGPPPPLDPHPSFRESQEAQADGGADENGNNTGDAANLGAPGNNVSCILVLPVHMRRGFGRVLIEFSYLLTKVEGRTGSPEKPLSDMGLVSYRSYWRGVLCQLLLRYKGASRGAAGEAALSVTDIAAETGMTPDDIIATLEALRFLVRDPVTRTYALRLDYDYMKEYVDKQEKKAHIKLDPERLCWTPYVMGRPTNLFTLGEEAAAPLQTVAPREDPHVAALQPEEGVQQSNQDAFNANTAMSENPPETIEDHKAEAVSPKSRRKTPPQLSLTPQPSFQGKSRASPSRRSPRKTPNGTRHHTRSASPVSIYSQSQPTSAGPVPPTRFEIFPPVPGMTAKRRPGRPYGRGGNRRSTGTPARRGPRPNASPLTGGASIRRTRSKLGEVARIADETEGLEAPEVAVEDAADGDAERQVTAEQEEEIVYE